MVTLKDVARESGYSISTVSLVLNNKKTRIPQRTKDHIVSIATKLNYRPNPNAVSLVTKKTNTIGLIIPDITNYYFAELAGIVENTVSESNYNLFLCNSNDNPKKDMDFSYDLIGRGIDGVLMVMSVSSEFNHAKEFIKLYKEASTPIVLIDRTIMSEDVTQVWSDNHYGGYIACKHLLEQGHKKIGVITGPLSSQSASNRLTGYISALKEYDIPFNPSFIKEGSYKIESGYNYIKYLLDQGITAVFAQNDMIAIGIYKYASENGIKIPKNLAIVGYDNFYLNDFLNVPLTSVRQSLKTTGKKAVEKLIEHIANPNKKTEKIVITPELSIRKSSKYRL